jgi:malonyl-CoA/methylmalonyl-CoA synthetase
MMDLFPRLAHPDDRVAVEIDAGPALGYRHLAHSCLAHAAALERAGVRPGDRVAVWTQYHAATVVALAGNALAGVVSVPLNPLVGDRELAHILADATPRCALAADPSAVAARTPGLSTVAAPVVLGDPGPPTVTARADTDAGADAPLLVVYTSGTTGAPKGAVLTASNVASNLDALAAAWRWTADATLVHALPLFHVHGLVLGLFGSLRVGGTLAWHERFAPPRVAASVAGAMLFAVPTMYHRLADFAERDAGAGRALANARLLVSGSAALPAREHARIERATGQRVVERYGLTETLINCAVRHDGDRRPGYVGPPLPGVELRLVTDARDVLDARDDATIGEVAVRGANVFAGYLNRPEATAAVRDADGWFYTGDLATRAPDGYVRVVGRRATDLIKTGGFKVGAGEVEAALLEHAGVSEAAVIGLPDDDLGEKIVAFVVPRDAAAPPDVQALVDLVAQALGPHKRPRGVHLVASLPRNAMGKVLKAALRSRS